MPCDPRGPTPTASEALAGYGEPVRVQFRQRQEQAIRLSGLSPVHWLRMRMVSKTFDLSSASGLRFKYS